MTVRMLISSFVSRMLSRLGVGLYRNTPKDQVSRVLGLFRPVNVGVDLTRIGPAGDGGYLLPDDFEELKTLYSPGVSDGAEFDKELAEMGVNCFLLDYSVDGPPINHHNFNFSKRFLGPVSHGNYVSLSDWISENEGEEAELILQMDIEGGEWGILSTTPSEVLSRFRIMVVEFHYLAAQISYPKTCEAVETLLARLRNDFDIVHLHPNNCCKEVFIRGIPIPPVIEITFLRKDRAAREASPATIPHPLDSPNVLGNREPRIPKAWL